MWYLLLGMLHVVVTEGLCDQVSVRAQCSGWPELRALVAGLTPEAMAPHAGVDAETIRRLAREHAAAPSAVLYAAKFPGTRKDNILRINVADSSANSAWISLRQTEIKRTNAMS
ncbi:hypothetical protein [Nocardia amikacinitolerans]|uniref:hypothetical protein n=1 Tax=Nocardia amikacinitolerans TaxID=756689 RepID=UPI0026CBD763